MRNNEYSRYSNSIPLFGSVPSEILDKILAYLEYGALTTLKHVSHSWETVMSGKHIIDYDLVLYGVILNSIEFIKWSMTAGYPRTHRSFKMAIQRGNVEIVKYLSSAFKPSTMASRYSIIAANGGHIEVLKWLHENDYQFTSEVCEAAASGGHLEVMKWLWDNKLFSLWFPGVLANAAGGGHLEVVQWLQTIGCKYGVTACDAAAMGGHLEVLKWLRENGCPWHANTCTEAAEQGHVDVLKWLLENGCPYNIYASRYAAISGHQKILEFLRINGCYWNERVIEVAVNNNHWLLAQWLIANGCPCSAHIRNIIARNCNY